MFIRKTIFCVVRRRRLFYAMLRFFSAIIVRFNYNNEVCLLYAFYRKTCNTFIVIRRSYFMCSCYSLNIRLIHDNST